MHLRHLPRFGRFVALVVALGLTPGCYAYSLTTGAPGDGVTRRAGGSNFFRGVIPARHHASECRHGLARVKTYMPWWAPIVSVFSLGIAMPWRSTYECAAPPSLSVAPRPVPPPPSRLVLPPEPEAPSVPPAPAPPELVPSPY